MVANAEQLGPAERIIQALIGYTDHMVHNRPGIVVPAQNPVGKQWFYCKRAKGEGEQSLCIRQDKVGHKTVPKRLGVIGPDNIVRDGARAVGEFREAGLFKEVAVWMYRQVAEVWKVDNEFAARWASYQYPLENRDLKVVLAAFLLVQSRKGDPVTEMRDGRAQFLFADEDFREIGEAMLLGPVNGPKGKELDPKQILRVRRVLELPEVVAINRELGFSRGRGTPYGRWETVVRKWLEHREANPKLMAGLVKAGMRRMVRTLAQLSHYKPQTQKFCQTLRWKQTQAKAGHRQVAIGAAIEAAETWEGLTEAEVCERIVKGRLAWKSVVPRIPAALGVTKAMVAAAIESGGFSDKELVVYAPTIESFGLLEDPAIKARWTAALSSAEDLRAANVAKRMRSAETKAEMVEAAEKVVQKAVEEVVRGIVVKVVVDISGSMDESIERAKELTAKIVQAFPPDKMSVSVFNTVGREVIIKHRSEAGVRQAFQGIRADGGTNYAAGVTALAHRKAGPDEDTVYFFIGDQENSFGANFESAFRDERPVAFGMLQVRGHGLCVKNTAVLMGIPCFDIDEKTFDDPYAIPRTLRALIAATPVGMMPKATQRVALAETILKTELLKRPVWAA